MYALARPAPSAAERLRLRLVPQPPPPPPLNAVLATAIAGAITRRLKVIDVEDFTSELVTEGIRCWPRFDPRRADQAAYLKLIMERRAVSLLRARRAAKRGGAENPTLRNMDLARVLAERRRATRDDLDHRCLIEDITAVLAKLPPSQRRACEMLGHMSLCDAARRLRVRRHKLLAFRSELRRRFQAAGIEEYLK